MATKKTASQKPKTASLASKKQKVRIRTYRHGLGDCHLLTFRKSNGSPFHMLIDCGVVDVTPEPAKLMGDLVRDIAKETGGILDIVVATHQHTDHLSGFQQAAKEFDKIKIKRLWLAWTEDPNNPLGKKIQKQLVKKLGAAREAATRLAKSGKKSDADAAARIKGILDFFGPAIAGSETQAILDSLHARSLSTADYFEPGAVFPLPEIPNVRVYVLGPPKDPLSLKITNPRKTKHEGYEIALAPAAAGFVDALEGDEGELSHPFDRRHRRSLADAVLNPFFRDHYFAADSGSAKDPEWRRIDNTWLEMAEQLALYLDDYTNNTSLALAFEFIDTGEVLFFPGDAQIGSWLTWHQLSWTVKEFDGSQKSVKTKDLFAKTIFYKAGHHASHNGTLSGLGENQTGLEHMIHRDLVCVVPVDKKMSIKKHWDRTLPWKPLLDRLSEKTRGRLILTDTNENPPVSAKLTNLSETERKRFDKQVKIQQGWIDYTL